MSFLYTVPDSFRDTYLKIKDEHGREGIKVIYIMTNGYYFYLCSSNYVKRIPTHF